MGGVRVLYFYFLRYRTCANGTYTLDRSGDHHRAHATNDRMECMIHNGYYQIPLYYPFDIQDGRSARIQLHTRSGDNDTPRDLSP